VAHSPKPPAEPVGNGKADRVGVGTATALTHSESPRNDTSGKPVAAAAFVDPAAQGGSGSSPLPLVVLILAGLVLSYAALRLWRLHQRRRLEALWHRRDADWEAVVHQIEIERGLSASKPSAERQKIDVG
jgi:hypothetical protein